MRNLHLTYIDKQPHFTCSNPSCRELTLLDFIVDGVDWNLGAICPACDRQLWIDEQAEEQHGPLHVVEGWQ